jgi:kynurenine formamidase
MSWHDLSHPIGPGTPYLAPFGPPCVEHVRSRPGDPYNATYLAMGCHVGTHVDAPCHFVDGGEAIDDLTLDRLHGDGVVVRLDVAVREPIEPSHFELAGKSAPRPGDLVFLDTGWWRHAGTEQYRAHPALTVAAAEWLVDRGVRMVAVDFPTPEIASDRRPEGFDWPVHRVLLEAGVLVAENVTGLEALSGRRVEVLCLPLNIAGADGAPARVVARLR